MKLRILKKIKKIFDKPWSFYKRIRTIQTLKNQLQKYRPKLIPYDVKPNSLLYVAASCLPYHISGYTIRTQEIVRALRGISNDVYVITRPGYPWDRKDRLSNPENSESKFEDITYCHSLYPSHSIGTLKYVLKATEIIEKVAIFQRVGVIHAASNHINALPALMAARKLGIPFQYEMRGIWELSRISRMPTFEISQAFKQGLQLEALVASHSDKLFVISKQLGNYVQENWGIASEKIFLLPNCIDPQRIYPDNISQVEPNTIGYAGSLITYEGLDTLIEAIDLLRKQGFNIKVNIIGAGEALQNLQELVEHFSLQDQIIFLGAIPQHKALAVLKNCALICIPRKPYKVCEIVPPIKLVEAMALAKPVILPDLPIFRDEVGDASSGLFFRPDDPIDLAKVLSIAFNNPNEMGLLGLKNRTFVEMHRTWNMHIQNILNSHS